MIDGYTLSVTKHQRILHRENYYQIMLATGIKLGSRLLHEIKNLIADE